MKTTTVAERFDRYLVETVFAMDKGLTQEQTRGVFLCALRDFFRGEVALSELASIATTLYYTLGNPFKINTEWEHDLGNALSDATEIDYYYEEIEKDKYAKEMYESMMKKMRAYYKDNKHFLKTKSGTPA